MNIEGIYLWQGHILETLTGIGVWIFGGAVMLIFISAFIGEQIRTRHMEALASELHCRFTRRRPGKRVPDEDERNIIEGVWRGQPILIYDLHIQEGEDSSRRTVINGKYYTGPFLAYLPIKKIRRVLAGDSTTIAKAMPDASLYPMIRGLPSKGLVTTLNRFGKSFILSIVIVIFVLIFVLIMGDNFLHF